MSNLAQKNSAEAPRDTRKEILKLGERLMVQRGYSGFSYADIAEPLGIRKAAVHYHFPSKEDLGLAILERYRHILREGTKDFMANGGDPIEQIEGYFGFSLRESARDGSLCPIGAVSLEFNNVPESLQESAQKLVDETITWLTRVLVVGREQSVFDFRGSPEAKAVAISAAVQGARQLMRTSDLDALSSTISLLREELGVVSS